MRRCLFTHSLLLAPGLAQAAAGVAPTACAAWPEGARALQGRWAQDFTRVPRGPRGTGRSDGGTLPLRGPTADEFAATPQTAAA